MDQDLGRIAQPGLTRYCGGSGACQGTPQIESKFEELEFLMGLEDSEVNLRFILTHARRRSRIFEIFSTTEKSEQ